MTMHVTGTPDQFGGGAMPVPGLEIYRTMPAGYIDGKTFNDRGMDALAPVLLGERVAAMAVLTTAVLGKTVSLFGIPGGAKTTLGRDAYRIIDGVSAADVAVIPSQADLKPQQVIGGWVGTERTVDDAEGSRTEKTGTRIKGLVQPNTKWIFANEYNRTAPHAVGALLEVLENNTLENSEGTFKLDLQGGVFTSNPDEIGENTFKTSKALARRLKLGARMGSEPANEIEEAELDADIDKMADGWEAAPEDIRPVISIDNLRYLRVAMQGLHIDATTKVKHFRPAVKGFVEVMKAMGIQEAHRSTAGEMAKTARAIAMLGGEPQVTPRAIHWAVHFMVNGRLGALKRDSGTLAPEAISRIAQHAQLHI